MIVQNFYCSLSKLYFSRNLVRIIFKCSEKIFIVSLYYFYNVYRIRNDAPLLIYNICYVCFYLLFLIGLARGLLSLLIFPKINLSNSKFLTLLFGMFVFYFINSRSDSYSFSLLLSLCYLAILFLTS